MLIKGPLPELKLLKLIHDLFLGLKELAHLKVIHRDIKPQNILISKDCFKFCGTISNKQDFGSACIVDDYESSVMTKVTGTPLFSSPQINNEEEYTSKTDIWSLGVVIFQSTFGRHPWKGQTETGLD